MCAATHDGMVNNTTEAPSTGGCADNVFRLLPMSSVSCCVRIGAVRTTT